MAWTDAILEVAEQMDAEAKDLEGTSDANIAQSMYLRTTLRGYAKQLRLVVKACEGEQVITSAPQPATVAQFMDPGYQNFLGVEEAKKQLRAEKERIQKEEHLGVTADGRPLAGMVAECVGGPEDGTYTPITPDMPVGAMTLLQNQVYEFRSDGKFYYDAEITKREYEKRGLPYVPWEKKSSILLS